MTYETMTHAILDAIDEGLALCQVGGWETWLVKYWLIARRG